VVPKERNINVIYNEIQWHTQGEQKDKTGHPVSRHGFAEDECYAHYDCAPDDNSNKEGEHSFLAKHGAKPDSASMLASNVTR